MTSRRTEASTPPPTTASAGRDEARRVLVVGAGYEQAPIILRARERGLHVVAVDADPDAPGFRHAHATYTVSTRSEDGILEVAENERIDAITSMITETPLRTIYRVGRALSLPSPSRRSVIVSTNKGAMRDAFRAHGIRNPPYARCQARDQAVAAADRIGVPLVVKPVDSGGQRGLTLCHELGDVAPAFDRAWSASSAREAIVERFVAGPEINVVAVVLDGTVEAMVASDRLKDEVDAFGVVKRHVYPSRAAASWERELRDLVQRSADAMDVRDGILFPQFVVGHEGPVLLETGARIPGGTMNELFRAATGIDLVDLQLDLAFGRPRAMATYRTHEPHPSVVVHFLTAHPGELTEGPVERITGEDEAARVPGILELGHFAGTRDRGHVHPLGTGADRYYYLLAAADDAATAIRACDAAWRRLDFLDGSGTSRRAGRDGLDGALAS